MSVALAATISDSQWEITTPYVLKWVLVILASKYQWEITNAYVLKLVLVSLASNSQ